jgi:hypothetical protein
MANPSAIGKVADSNLRTLFHKWLELVMCIYVNLDYD